MNKKQNKNYFKEYYKKNRERILARCSSYYSKNKDKKRVYSKKYRDKNPAKMKDQKLKYLYGITLKHWNEMFKDQQGACKICLKTSVELVVDHCHDSGKVRGLLCNLCNGMVGRLNQESFSRAIQYLTSPKEEKLSYHSLVA